MNILIISGSLRAKSSTLAVINAVMKPGVGEANFELYHNIGKLPHFNEDDNEEVKNFRLKIKEADGVLICTPEYAFGVPGALKNALDWTVSSGEFYNKPVGIICASTNGMYAFDSLMLTMKALTASIYPEAAIIIPFIKSKIDKDGTIKNPEVLGQIKVVMGALIKNVKEVKDNTE